MAGHSYNMKYVWAISMTAALGGLLFGYDWVVIGGAKPFFQEYFHLTGDDNTGAIGWAMSCALLGCFLGSIITGILSDRYGRKKLLVVAAFLFIVTAMATGLAGSFTLFIIYRISNGVAIGMASNLSPIYIAEVAPSEKRGRLVSVNQLSIVIGVLLAQLINWIIAQPMPAGIEGAAILETWNGQYGWRWMFIAASFPAVLFFILVFFIPESPRWLIKNGNETDAARVLKKIGGDRYAFKILTEVKESLKQEKGRVSYKALIQPGIFKIVLLGIFLAFLQQWSGNNTIFYYAQEVFTQAGYPVSDVLFNIVITGSVMLVFTFIAIGTVDRVGRKWLMLIGCIGMGVSEILLGLSYQFSITGLPLVLLVLLVVAFYSFTLAPVTWVLISEIFPNRIRGAAVSVATSSLWISSFMLIYLFPFMNKAGISVPFYIYAGILLVGYFVIKTMLPETRGKSLEQIEKSLT
ncbi:MAG: sugar porter family MFS transporter [Bacteroidales bacterium]|nr:sugar porter family MFS transporter [Bacteroidales bacterium]